MAKPPSDYVDPSTAERLWAYDRYPVICSSLVLQMIARVRRELRSVTSPMLVIASHRDNVVSAKGVDLLVQRAASPVKQLLWLERSSHAITADGEWPMVCERSLLFLDALPLA